jgi:hypothetical protein
MHAKFVIFVAVSTLFVAAIYSSSTYFVFADVSTTCTYTSKTTSHCTVFDEDGQHSFKCKKNKDGKTWSCVQDTSSMVTSNIPSALKDAIDKAKSGALTGENAGSNNDTSFLQGKVLKHGGALKGAETDNNAPTNSSGPLQ